MKRKKIALSWLLFSVIFTFLSFCLLAAEEVTFQHRQVQDFEEFTLTNQQIILSLTYKNKKLVAENIKAQADWLTIFGHQEVALTTDGGFGIDLMWTGWRAPRKINNAANPVVLTKHDFVLEDFRVRKLSTGVVELSFFCKLSYRGSLRIKLVYQLHPQDFFYRRRLEIQDSSSRGHFLRWLWPYLTKQRGKLTLVKTGGFGQPIAFLTGDGGGFVGLEYPTAENHFLCRGTQQAELRCGQEIGLKITQDWIPSEWAVVALTPTKEVKLWFWKYLEKIKVAPARPYLLYNSWYDLRAPVMVKDEARVLNETNVLRAIASFRRRLIKKRGLSLDAFVLDDGWDIYQSDWQVNPDQFPAGFKPISQALEAMGSQLGIWFGPIGGYSHRDWRLNWMREQGYETVGDQLCVAGKKYHALLRQRVTDFVRQYKVGYYKWDGIQFSCSEPDHGHLPGIYSRRAVMEAVIDLCQAVRKENPDIFLNITSGTWLSPWWLKYANTIWMQGSDYGYADVPSISRRDRAMTYRDDVLYEDLRHQDFWFPLAHLMTHGIIKGHLNQLGGAEESLEEFTDNAFLYFARGIAMWELYISPDFLTDAQWDVLAAAIRWAKDRFPVLMHTEMVGGDPGQREPYAYVHFLEKKGIIAARNPFIEPRILRIKLNPSLGLNPEATNLVVERKYPASWVYPALVKAKDDILLPLNGYETAIYEIYPVEEAQKPLIAGCLFEWKKISDQRGELVCYPGDQPAFFLNPEFLGEVEIKGEKLSPRQVKLPPLIEATKVETSAINSEDGLLEFDLNLHSSVKKAMLAFLLEPVTDDKGLPLPQLKVWVDGQERALSPEKQEGSWAWFKINLEAGSHHLRAHFVHRSEENQSSPTWRGKLSLWLVSEETPSLTHIVCHLKDKSKDERPQLPRIWPPEMVKVNHKLGQFDLILNQK